MGEEADFIQVSQFNDPNIIVSRILEKYITLKAHVRSTYVHIPLAATLLTGTIKSSGCDIKSLI